jgi:hypothetical protein
MAYTIYENISKTGGVKAGEVEIIAVGSNGKSVYNYSDELYSDLYKDTTGFRPSQLQMEMWNLSTPEEKQTEWDYLVDELARNEAERKENEAIAIKKFEKQIEMVMGLNGTLTRTQAINWLLEAWYFSQDIDTENDNDFGYFEYCHDLPYGYIIGMD